MGGIIWRLSGAAARTGSVKEINNNNNMDNTKEKHGEFQKRTNNTETKSKNLNSIESVGNIRILEVVWLFGINVRIVDTIGFIATYKL